jgi:hypothetical protein
MSSHWRCWGSAFLLFAGFSVTPAFSDPLTDLTDLFSPSTKEAAAPAPTQEECLLQPGKSTLGQHWVYRLEGHRKCWFQTDEANVSTKKQAHHHAEKQPVVPPAKNEAALREKKILDARAQLLSAAPAEALPPTDPAPEVVDAASVPINGTATLVPAAPAVTAPPIDQLRSQQATQHPVDVDKLLAAGSLKSDAVDTSMPAATSAAPAMPDAGQGNWELTATRAGLVLVALGLVFLLGSLLASRFLGPRIAPIHHA